MKPLWDLENPVGLQEFVIQELKNIGIKVPRSKKIKNQELPACQAVFGNYLCYLPCIPVENCGHVPRFLVNAVEFIEQFIDTEGLFRKSGAVSRQKELKLQIENDGGFSDVQVFDVTGVVKQFFRELPDPLLTNKYHDTFIKCYQLSDRDQAASSILDLCLLLPGEHLGTLRYFMRFLARVADNSQVNKMDATNLAVVLGPNIMHVNTNRTEKMNSSEEKLLQTQTAIVEFLIRNAEKIGIVSTSLVDRVKLMEGLEEVSVEERTDVTVDETVKRSKRKKRRSSSLQGFVSNIAQSLAKWRTTPVKSTSSQLSHSSSENIPADVPASLPVMTPKLMRKRKASGEALVFSAAKRKAILMQMPQTPFTPGSLKSLPPEIQKALERGTPNINFSKEQKIEFTATPEKKKSRKRLSLFSPSGARKSKSWSVTTSSSNLKLAVPKEKKRGLLRRLSGGKSKAESPSCSKQLCQQIVGERLASPAKGKADDRHTYSVTKESPIAALFSSKEAACLQLEQTGQADRFFSPKKVDLERSHSTQHKSYPSSAIERTNVRLHLRTRSVEAALIRGKPNTVANGLNSGEVQLPLKVRREPLRRRCSRSRSLHTTSRRHLVIENVYVSRSSSQRSSRHSKTKLVSSERSPSKSSTSPGVILAPPEEFADLPESEGTNDDTGMNESECGFSTNSGDTVIFVPSKNVSLETKYGHKSITQAVKEMEEQGKVLADQQQSAQGGGSDSAKDNLGVTGTSARKASSLANLQKPCSSETTATCSRSQSMYERVGKSQHAAPNLLVSADTCKLLTRAGYVKEMGKVRQEVETQPREENIEERAPIKRAMAKIAHHESVLGLRVNNKGSVAQKAQKLAEKHAYETERHKSPLRFPKSTSRTRGASPVGIPKIFARGDSDAERFRQMALNSLRRDCHGPVRRTSANLPISTQLLRPSAEATGCCQTQSSQDSKISCRRKPSIYNVQNEPPRTGSHKLARQGVNPVAKLTSSVMCTDNTDCNPDMVTAHVEAMSNEDSVLQSTVDGDSVFNLTPHPFGDFTEEAENSITTMDLSGITNAALYPCSLKPSQRFSLSASLQETINDVCTPVSKKVLKKHAKVSPNTPQEGNQVHGCDERNPCTPHIRQALMERSNGPHVHLRTSKGMTPRHLHLHKSSPASPLKAVKRLASPKSVYRASSRRGTPPSKRLATQATALTCIPSHLQEQSGANL
ncbi:uncharacterized protein LOC135468632 [Liolophura sinensis]|uniref:uncharacterized protein LOC135468632 n=1 Tax=Liolophura sinensis TaxID=3198878 RepID=UPI003158507E